jgi:hypothetical protein
MAAGMKFGPELTKRVRMKRRRFLQSIARGTERQKLLIGFLCMLASLGLAVHGDLLVAASAQVVVQPLEEKLADSYRILDAVRIATADALDAHAIELDDAKQIQDLSLQARTLLDSARRLRSTNLNDANAKLLLASTVLTQLQDYAKLLLDRD